MNELVRILTNDDGDTPDNNHNWHLVDPCNWQGKATLCTAEFFGSGESACIYETKEVIRGGVTCPNCMKMIKNYKKIKL